MGITKKEQTSLFWLLFPFFGLWLFFWLVPLFFGIDLALQDSSHLSGHRDSFESSIGESSGFGFSWLDKDKSSGQRQDAAKYVGFENFRRVLGDAKFYKALKNTSMYVFGSVVIIIPLAFALGLSLFQLGRLPRGLIVFCLMVPGLALPGVLSTLFYLFFHGRTGALNQYLLAPLGLQPVNWMMDPLFIMPSLVMQSVWRWTGLVTLFFLCGLESIPRWQLEASDIEGAGMGMKIRTVFLPCLAPFCLFAMVFLVVDGFASFSGAYNLLGGSGGILDSGLLLVTYIYQVAFPGGSGRFDFPAATAMSLLVVPLTASVLFLVLRYRKRRMPR